MNRIECLREFDVLEAVGSGRWAAGAFPEIEAHLVECPICADLATVVAALAPDRDERRQEARVPPSAHVWWRAQVRARQEAAAAASRPITIAQGVAAASAIGLSCGAIAAWWDAISSPVRLRWDLFAEWIAAPATEWMLMALRTAGPAVPLGILAAGLVLMPVAFYFVFSEKWLAAWTARSFRTSFARLVPSDGPASVVSRWNVRSVNCSSQLGS